MVFISAKKPLCGVGETRVSVATRGNKTAWNPPLYLTKGGMVGRSGLVASGHDSEGERKIGVGFMECFTQRNLVQ